LADITETLHDDEDVMLSKLEELLSVGDEGHDEFNCIVLEEDRKKVAWRFDFPGECGRVGGVIAGGVKLVSSPTVFSALMCCSASIDSVCNSRTNPHILTLLEMAL
jgi:hypothetical protein